MNRKPRTQRPQRGLVLVTFSISILVLLLFFGLAVDVGLLYISRAALAKGSDAAALRGVRALSQGEAAATQTALAVFAMNYASSGLAARQVEDPQVNVSFGLDANGNKRITVNSSVRVSTFLLRVLPEFARVNVHAVAQAARARLVMGIALDRSGSMTGNGGSSALPGAVRTFAGYFDEANDRVALSSYADHASLDVSLRYAFKTPISNRVGSMPFSGWTYSHGGIDIARAQINTVPSDPNENLLHALVFFTDGHANSFLVGNPPGVRCTGNNRLSLVLVPDSGNDGFRNPANGADVTCTRSESDSFFSLITNGNRNRTANNVEAEGLFMAERSAQFARQDGTLVFAIGLGNDINQASLRKMANDPSSASFNPAQPEGLAVFAPNSAQLDDMFRQIAAKILLRLTQ